MALTPKRRLAAAVMTVPLILMVLVAFLLPVALAYSLVERGLEHGHYSWVTLGGLTAAMWLFGLYLTVRSWARRGRS